MSEPTIATRVRRWRMRRNLSQRALAERAGFTQGYVSQIETGRAHLDRQATLQAIAEALEISIFELTGRSGDPRALEISSVERTMSVLRTALLSLAWEPRDPHSKSAVPRPDITAVGQLHADCRYNVSIGALANAITDLHARCGSTNVPADPVDLRALTLATFYAASNCFDLGYFDLALLAADRCRTVAQRLTEPGYLGVAHFAVLRAVAGSEVDLGQQLLRNAQQHIEPYIGQDTISTQMYGMTMLMNAVIEAAHGHTEPALAHLREAQRLAEHTGECSFSVFWYGPTNVGIWHRTILVELLEGPRMLNDDLRPDLLRSRNRRSTYYLDLGRAFAQARGRDTDAVAALLHAETIAPQMFRRHWGIEHAVRTLLGRARTGNSRALRDLADRVGLV